MKLLLKGGRIIDPSQTIDRIGDLLIAEGRIVAIGGGLDDADAVVIDASFSRAMLRRLIEATEAAMLAYDWEGLWPARLVAGIIGSDARALGGALLPLHENFAPDRDIFLKAG